MNGIPFNSTFDGQFDPTLIPTSQIDRVKVTTGSTSELYGAGAMAVIDLLTRSTREDLLQIDTEFGSWNHRYMSIQAGGNQDKLDYYGNFTHRNRDNFKVSGDFTPTSVEDGGKRLNSDLERNTGFGSLSYKVNEALQVGLNGSFMFGSFRG